MFLTSTSGRIRAASGDRSAFGSFWFSPVGQLTRSGARVNSGSALTLPTVLACVRVLAESFAIMPPMLYAPKARGGRTRLTRHWLYRLLAKSPNRFQTPYEWRMMLQGHLALRGNAFNQITSNDRGEIVELLPLHPGRMVIETLDNGSYRYRYTDQHGQTVFYARDEIWHLRGLSDDGLMGLSMVTLAANAIGEGLAMQSYSSRFFANDAKPGGGIINFDGKFADKAAKATFRESWQQMQGGANAGKVAVLEKGMTFQELGLSNKDSQFIEGRKEMGKEVAQIFRVPPHKVGILDNATFSNIEQQSIEFWQDTMLPWAELWESSAEFNLLGPDVDIEVEFDMARMMRGDGAARATRISTLVNCGVMTRNEGREEENLDPIEGLDEPLRPLNMVEESDAGAAPPTPAGPPRGPAPTEDDEEEDDSADARRSRRRADKAHGREAAQAAAEQREQRARTEPQRLAALLRSNAHRLARRIADGKPVGAEVIADAMAVDINRATVWLGSAPPQDEVAIVASLLVLSGVPGTLDASAQALSRVAVAVADAPAPVMNVSPAAVHLEGLVVHNHVAPALAPIVNVTTPQPQVDVHVAAPAVTFTTPEPVVHVSVAAPDVQVHNEVQAAQAPNVSVNVEAPPAKQADKPWPTRTTIKRRDGQGRADVIETTPID